MQVVLELLVRVTIRFSLYNIIRKFGLCDHLFTLLLCCSSKHLLYIVSNKTPKHACSYIGSHLVTPSPQALYDNARAVLYGVALFRNIVFC